MTYKKEQLKYLTQKQMDKTKMRVIFVFIVVIGCFHNEIWAQTGVVTTDPDASLHIDATSKTDPSGADGVLIPRLADFPGNGVEKGHFIFLKDHPTVEEGFYFWDGTTWVWLINNYDRTIDTAIFIASGSGYTGTGNSRVVNFSRIDAFDPTGFSVAANNVTIGKTGRYLVTFTTSVKRTGSATGARQANFTYQLFRNNLRYGKGLCHIQRI
ncbi:hypothetical protein ACFSKL_22245 [Belliella marina]|uniref:Uncharacterized protein n=1 Tax=Belliella marina TaxID=1644146 RepID=A0ABW4VUU1_9BACT